MVFRIVAGSGDNPVAIWTSNTAYNEDLANIRTADENVAGTYKSPLVDSDWNKVKTVCCFSSPLPVFANKFCMGHFKHYFCKLSAIV